MPDISNLLELLENAESSGGKKYIFPRNVTKEYNIIPGVTGRVILKYFLPGTIAMVLVLIVPSFTKTAWILKSIVDLIILTIVIILAVARPIGARKNISVIQYLVYRRNFMKKQKRCYVDGKKGEL